MTQLAEGYTRTNRPDLALKTRLEGVANLQKAGFTRESNQVLDAIPKDQLKRATPEIRTQVKKLRTVALQPRD